MIEPSSSLCWECGNATGKCSWSEDLIPVKGWKAEDSVKDGMPTYLVLECPEFERDSLDKGLRRLPQK